MNEPGNNLAMVFQDMDGHRSSAEIIQQHSSNKSDIREVALKGIPLSNCRTIIDLGCGFGYFTEALTNRIGLESVVTGIDCHENYRKPFLDLCTRCGFQGMFSSSGTEYLKDLAPQSADLILCSFSIYFFPGVLKQISRILKEKGTFVVITHSVYHLKEITDIVLKTLHKNGIDENNKLPHDELIGSFAGENGKTLLADHFKTIIEKEYRNSLLFEPGSIDKLLTYFKYKRTFFIPPELINNNELIADVENEIRNRVIEHKKLSITKNDFIFHCSQPVKN